MADISNGGESIDRHFATNLKETREQQGFSQEELARLMTDRGFQFTQATVWKIESWQRGVRIAEAVALAEVLSRPLWLMYEAPITVRAISALKASIQSAEEAFDSITASTVRYMEELLRLMVEAFGTLSMDEVDDSLRAQVQRWLDMPPERAVMEGRAQYFHRDIETGEGMVIDQILAEMRKAGWVQNLDVEKMRAASGLKRQAAAKDKRKA